MVSLEERVATLEGSQERLIQMQESLDHRLNTITLMLAGSWVTLMATVITGILLQ